MAEFMCGLRVLDGRQLGTAHRRALRPGGRVRVGDGRTLRLPDYFLEVPSWDRALETPLAPHFGAFEFLDVDVREVEPLRAFPRYLPCAVVAFAAALQRFRDAIGVPVRIAANGGYRSPSHALSAPGSPHVWGAAADIYRIGGDYLDRPDRIRRYAEAARAAMAGVWTREPGDRPGQAFDHLHLDLGYLTLVPRSRPPGEETS